VCGVNVLVMCLVKVEHERYDRAADEWGATVL